ncbi:MAG: proton-conducting membrane transporter [Lachnospiraceae bacterium]|nr:proton-conducting membrane transporter [Lachnospiraceae bacterium]
MQTVLLIVPVLLPLLFGGLIAVLRSKDRKTAVLLTAAALVLEAGFVTALCCLKEAELFLFSMTEELTVRLRMDGVSRVFLLISAWGFLLAGIFSFRYMDHEEKEGSYPEKLFYCFYLFSLTALVGMALSDNLITLYLFFEMLTLLSMPLVLFERTKEATAAALKYLFYSIGGAFLALGSIFVLYAYGGAGSFALGGTLDPAAAAGHETLLLIMILLGVIGFGAKAGLYPLHAWLPTAHPVAPAPASAVLSGIIAKAGVLAIVRMIFFTAGPELIRGTYVQYVLLSAALLTVFMGSMMAYREKLFKKRLAYSSISQIAYALFGFFLLNTAGFVGGMLQVVFHAIVKICLFLTAGSLIYNTERKSVDEYRGLGRVMPVTFVSFTLASLSLIGIPPFGGFISKWYLAEGALSSGLPVFDWLGPVILLISALLTAGYLLPLSIAAFFPGKNFDEKSVKQYSEGGLLMLIPLVTLAALSLIGGLAGEALRRAFELMLS